MPYAEVLEDARRPGAVRIGFRNTLVPDLGDELIAAIEGLFGAHRTALTLRSLGGAVARVPADATAFAHRDAEAMLVAGMFLPADATPAQAGEAVARWAPLAARGSGAYVNFLGSASDADVAAVYPPATYQRLAAVKRAYDPQNVFRRNHNIRPSQGCPSRQPPGVG
jgi:FAD/FMN-containing dehydrogenase